MRLFLFLLTLSALLSCSTPPRAPEGLDLMPVDHYREIVERYTHRSQKYTGIYNTMDVTATLVNSAVARGQVEQKARLQQWTPAQFAEELEKTKKSLGNETVVFVSFYTPDRKNDDLQKLTTQWRIYLEAEGRRWEPKVTRLRQPLAEIQGLYSYHTRFSTAYVMSFPIATTTVEKVPTRFIITGPLGIVTLDYKPIDETLLRRH